MNGINTDIGLLLRIQTSSSSELKVYKNLFPFDDDIIQHCYNIREGDNPIYWESKWHQNFSEVFSLIEFPNQNVACNRDYVSWWLNCRPWFIHESIVPILKERVETYYKTGEIKLAMEYAGCGLEFDQNCLLIWHEKLGITLDEKYAQLIDEGFAPPLDLITIQFQGFTNVCHKITYAKTSFEDFQHLLNWLFKTVPMKVNPHSYGKEWVLYDSNSGRILEKSSSTYDNLDFNGRMRNQVKLVCYKL